MTSYAGLSVDQFKLLDVFRENLQTLIKSLDKSIDFTKTFNDIDQKYEGLAQKRIATLEENTGDKESPFREQNYKRLHDSWKEAEKLASVFAIAVSMREEGKLTEDQITSCSNEARQETKTFISDYDLDKHGLIPLKTYLGINTPIFPNF